MIAVKNESISDLNIMDEIVMITTYPPRECGIATYSQDLITAINNKFNHSFSIKVCALESGKVSYNYPKEVKYKLNTSSTEEYEHLAQTINKNKRITIVMIQHEFGLFMENESAFLQFLSALNKPVVIAFHTVLPHPNELLKSKVKIITDACESIIVMTDNSLGILEHDYGVDPKKVKVIAHGTHLVPHLNKSKLKLKYGLKGRKVLATFGLLGPGKGIETTIDAMPTIVKEHPDVVFLVIGKTHPEVVKNHGEIYRESLAFKVQEYGLQNNVVFINKYVALNELLEYLQLTDIYLFTATDPNQAVSGTFSYAMSCACPIISTPIPHAREVLSADTGIIFDFHNAQQLSDSVNKLLSNKSLRKHLSANSLQKIISTAWENSAISHASLLNFVSAGKITLHYNLPVFNLSHLNNLTTKTGIIQFSKINQPDIETGYTLDDNARALVALCKYFKTTGDDSCFLNIQKYLNFIKYCLKPSGQFYNYVDKHLHFTDQNNEVNLDDSNGRTIWALGYVTSLTGLLPRNITTEAEMMLKKSLQQIENVYSTRAMAFVIKGIYYYHLANHSTEYIHLAQTFANRLVQMYKHEATGEWEWFEGYLTYANSILPEALLYAWKLTEEPTYKDIAKKTLHFLLSQIFNENGIEVISNKKWLIKGEEADQFGEQPIDVAYTIMTLSKFYNEFHDVALLKKMITAFNWFLGNNRLHQIIYNPCTGGCYDGLEKSNVNLNQGAESTISYLLARLTIDHYQGIDLHQKMDIQKFIKLAKHPIKKVRQPVKRKESVSLTLLSLPSHT